MREVIRVEDSYYILAGSGLADDRVRVLKHGDMFAVFDRYGDIQPAGRGAQGLYVGDTRFLSYLTLHLGGERPLLLSSTVKEDNVELSVDLTNPDLRVEDQRMVKRGSLHVTRSKFLWEGCCYERLHISNFSLQPVETILTVEFAADFADMFEVRGQRRTRRGRLIPQGVRGGEIVLAYEGLDSVTRRCRLLPAPEPEAASPRDIRFRLRLQPKEETTCDLRISCEVGEGSCELLSYEEAWAETRRALRKVVTKSTTLYSSNEQFNDWLNRCTWDLQSMIFGNPEGAFPYAGIPWFNTVFGRDGLITAFETLWIYPWIAASVLSYLAETQAAEDNAESDAEPGKILHEMRKGEMAVLGEHPFRKYYGSADATPLFIILAGAYYDRTADRRLIERIWPAVERALNWIDTYGDLDGDGFVEYQRRSSKGLLHQGWKDSGDSIFHADGNVAEPPIALCEVQAYVYAAKLEAAKLAELLGKSQRAEVLRRQARSLQEQFEQAFWCEELSCYALALDGRKRPCRVRSSNAGYALFAGIANPDRAARMAHTLFGDDMFSGWGIRTLSTQAVRFNPMSYHNGSVWPHDNALIGWGLARYGFKHYVLRILTGLFDASLFLELHRLPELFCGFARRPGEGPTLYPVACAPQSWSVAAAFILLQACLGLTIDGPRAQVRFTHARLPEFISTLRIRNLRVGKASLDLSLQRFPNDVGVTVLQRHRSVEIVSVK